MFHILRVEFNNLKIKLPMTRKDYILLMAKSGMLALRPYQNLFAKDHKIKSWTSEESFLNSKEGKLIAKSE